MENNHCVFKVKENRGYIDLKILIVDFDSVKNCDLFISTFSKFLILNKFSLGEELSFVNFSSTYEKSKRIHEVVTGKLFELVLERNEKPITGGAFGFSDRLKIFLTDENKHSPIFDSCVRENKIKLADVSKVKQSDIENLVTLTSSRGVGKTGISLRDKSIGMWRFDELTSVEGRFNPCNQIIEPWRGRIKSDFTQLGGRIACIGDGSKKDKRRIAIIARASRKKQNLEEDGGIFTWLDCLELFEAIPSIKINKNILFCSYNSKTSMKTEDPTLLIPKNRELYYNRIEEVNPDQLLHKIFDHLLGEKSIMPKGMKQKEKKLKISNPMPKPVEISSILSGSVKNCVRYSIGLTEQFLDELCLEYGLNKKYISVRFKDNASHLFSTLRFESIKNKLKILDEEYQLKLSNKKIDEKMSFEDYLLGTWVNDEKYKSARKRQRIIGMSVERCVYNSTGIEKFKTFLTANEQELYKVRLIKVLKRIYK